MKIARKEPDHKWITKRRATILFFSDGYDIYLKPIFAYKVHAKFIFEICFPFDSRAIK